MVFWSRTTQRTTLPEFSLPIMIIRAYLDELDTTNRADDAWVG